MYRLLAFFAVCIFWVASPFAQVDVQADEALNLQVVYRGVFSAGKDMPIADVMLHTRSPGQNTQYMETEVEVSSKAYSFVESLYPIRYRFRSWYKTDRSTCLAAEYYEKNNRRDEPRHRLIYFDREKRPFITHDVVLEGQLGLPALQAGRYPVRQHTPPVMRFDRLGFLQHVRSLPLAVGYEADIPVSNGKYMMRYHIRVEKSEQVTVAGKAWKSIKVRFDGFKPEGDEEEAAHRPLYLWLSDDEKRLPLRGVVRHTLGHFTFELTNQQVIQH
jgi:hypothetical protein